MSLTYDNRFDRAVLVDLGAEDCSKDRLRDVLAEGVDPSEYVTQDELQEHFSLSRYQISNFLKEISAEPIGELKNYDESGRRLRGVGKHVYDRSVIEQIEKLTASTIDIEEIKRRALLQIEES